MSAIRTEHGVPQKLGRGGPATVPTQPIVVAKSEFVNVAQARQDLGRPRPSNVEVIRSVIIGCEVSNDEAIALIIACAESLKVAA